MSDQILVIKTNVLIPETMMQHLHQSISDQIKNSDVVIIPAFCEVILAPKDIEIKFEEGADIA